MFVALWEFEVKSGCEEGFERVYGREGEWARLFRKHGSYLETRLLHDTTRRGVYVTLDFWATQAAFEEFLRDHAGEYQQLDATAQGLIVRERKIGWYEG